MSNEYTYSMSSEKLNSELFKNFIQIFFFVSVQYKTINTIRKKNKSERIFFIIQLTKNWVFFEYYYFVLLP